MAGAEPRTRLARLDDLAGRDPDVVPDVVGALPEDTFALMVGIGGPGPLRPAESIEACAQHVREVVAADAGPDGARLWLLLTAGPTPDGPVARHLGVRRDVEALAETTAFPAAAWGPAASVPGAERRRHFASAAQVATGDLLVAAVRAVFATGRRSALLWTVADLADAAALGAVLEETLDRSRTDVAPDVRRLAPRRIAAGDVVGLPAGDVDGTERRIDWLGTREALRTITSPQGRRAAGL